MCSCQFPENFVAELYWAGGIVAISAIVNKLADRFTRRIC
ncbi:hypothetical protein BIFADO_02446 [Bifidobacterium adolescentis L2-32]|uniref:Uncharacterized protein n=1 Tax=Bifidobacterium adolescentis L2-32 TaxID=411481 RepID=A7A999_BIFAD|nr:hypothetical protein BIFADO_02446 [Bifidobacterium adolescentis L2-32]